MRDEDDEGLEALFKDLWRELTPVVRYCLFGGMALGFGLALLLIELVPPDAPADSFGYIVARGGFFFVCGVTVTVALMGTAVGVVVEVMTSRREGSVKKKSVRKRPRRKNRE